MRGVLSLTVLAVMPVCAANHPNEVIHWNDVANRASQMSGLSGNPLFEARVYAIMHVAIHDALNAIDRRYETYALHGGAPAHASPGAAVATAAYEVLANQFKLLEAKDFHLPAGFLVRALEASLGRIPDGPGKQVGIAVGRRAANAILRLRASDGWDQQIIADPSFPQGTAPGEWRFTPPNDFAFLPNWGDLQPFALFRSNQFLPGPPYPVNSAPYTADYNEIKRLGGDGVTTPSERTADQTQIARFWYESSPQGWNRIARLVATEKGRGLWGSARLFGLLNLALADGYIANFESKYHYRYWRPITAIRLGDKDGNANTNGDPTWTPLLDTPPVPDYESGHSLQGGAAATILRLFFGTDHIAFTTCSNTMANAAEQCGGLAEVRRTFPTFSRAEAENALSRILVGIHFRKATVEGIEHGRKIARHVFVTQLRPLRTN